MRQKKRDEQRQNAHNERFRIVNCSRTPAEEDAAASTAESIGVAKEITILDIEKERLAGSSVAVPVPVEVDQSQGMSDGGVDYVYDLYVPDVGQPELEWSEQFLENMLRFVPVDEDIHLTFSYTYF